LSGDVQQALVSFGILHHRLRLAVNCKNERFLRLFEMLQNFPGLRRNVVIA
jgi:hypothetical protein